MRNDPDRLQTLRQLLILDSPKEDVYDDFTTMLAASLDAPIAMVNMIDSDRDWFKACIGLPVRESPAATSFCETFFHTPESLIVAEDTLLDARFKTHPFVIGSPFIRFYAGARLEVDGRTVGTLCAYDIRPKQVSLDQLEHMRVLAGSVVQTLKARRRG